MKVIEREGKTVEEAIQNALNELEVSMDDVEVEVLRKEGLFKTACVRVTRKPSIEDKAMDFLDGLIDLMNVDTSLELIESEDITINLVGQDNGIVIGHRGEVLDALQYLTTIVANKNIKEYQKITVDAENYRNKRKDTLISLANRLADKAINSGRAVEVEPMNAYERKIFHTALSDNEQVTTESEGDTPYRYVVITPQDVKDGGGIQDFSRKGLGKMKSFGNKKRRY